MTTPERRAQMADYYAENRDRIRAHRRHRWATMPADVREAKLAYYRMAVKRWEQAVNARVRAKHAVR